MHVDIWVQNNLFFYLFIEEFELTYNILIFSITHIICEIQLDQ